VSELPHPLQIVESALLAVQRVSRMADDMRAAARLVSGVAEDDPDRLAPRSTHPGLADTGRALARASPAPTGYAGSSRFWNDDL